MWRLQLRSLQYLERYVYLILFNAYLHLERADSWQRPFSTWMREVRREARGSSPPGPRTPAPLSSEATSHLPLHRKCPFGRDHCLGGLWVPAQCLHCV